MRRPEGTCASCWQPHPPSQERCFGPPAASSPDEGGGTVHAVPPHGSANTPCCDRSPFDLPAADRITVNAAEVTCASADEGARQRPDTAALLVIADWLVRTLPGHRGAEQTAATLAYTARWIDAQPPVPPTPTPCPYIVTGGEGTSHCALAESRPAPVERPQPDELPEGVERLSDGGLVCRGSVIPTLGAGWEWGLPDGWRPCTDRPKFGRSAEVIYDVRPAPTDGEP